MESISDIFNSNSVFIIEDIIHDMKLYHETKPKFKNSSSSRGSLFYKPGYLYRVFTIYSSAWISFYVYLL